MMMYTCVTIFFFISLVVSVPVDNGVENDPEFDCLPNSIVVSFDLRNRFEGQIYIKGLFDDENCRKIGDNEFVASMEVPFESCNVARTRSLNPKGIGVEATFVIKFHPQFITKVDRAYKVKCFYMEADKTVPNELELEVSTITAIVATQPVPMPICRYEILEGGPTGEPVQYALIGDQVYHKWTCETEAKNTFCITVHSCFVEDSNGENREPLLDENGCALDKYLINNLEYPSDLMAGVEAHVFKYADRIQLFFQCQISVTTKNPDETCGRPACPTPDGRGDGKGTRKRRSAIDFKSGVTDVRTEMKALAIEDYNNNVSPQIGHHDDLNEKEEFCLSFLLFSMFVSLGFTFIVIFVSITSYCLMKHM